MHRFEDIPLLPDDPIFSLPTLYGRDARPDKVNLGIGVYQDEAGKPTVFSAIRKAEALILDEKLGKDYQPIEGNPEYIRETTNLILGNHHSAENRMFAAQTVGGACALRLGAEFLLALGGKKIYLPGPTWANHKNIFKRAGADVHSYPYFDPIECAIDFDALEKALLAISPGSALLLQACGHNPTGTDMTLDQWQKLSELVKKQGLIPFFDVAYQGFADGIEQDAAPVRLFANDGHNMLVAYSFSKNMGLYGERAGTLAVVAQQAEAIPKIASQLRQMIRGIYSTPPLQGGRLAAAVLSNPVLKEEWLQELEQMRQRLSSKRERLASLLEKGSRQRNFQFLREQKGMFSFCGLTSHHVQQLIQEFAIYMPMDGRINIAGVNDGNINYVSHAILKVMSA